MKFNHFFIQATVPDARVRAKQAKVDQLHLPTQPKIIQVIDVLTVKKNLTKTQLTKLAVAFTNPVTQQTTINRVLRLPKHHWVIQITFLPGVTDNIANTAKSAITEALHQPFHDQESVWSAQIYILHGNVSQKIADQIASVFANPLIQKITVLKSTQFVSKPTVALIPIEVKLHPSTKVIGIDLNIVDEELVKIGTAGIIDQAGNRRGSLALDLPNLKAIQTHFKKLGRNPTDVELESIAQTWSEHCKHTIFAHPIDEVKDGLFRHYIKRATAQILNRPDKKNFCLSVFTDNAGAIIFDDTYLVTDKVETHNSPSALDPFGGSITGIVGVNRDALGFGLGAKPILNRYGFCFAPATNTQKLYRDAQQRQPLLSAERIKEGVIAGVNSGGNCSGIPTPQGFVYYDDRFRGKPLVFVGTLGLMPRRHQRRVLYEKQAMPGDYIVVAGGRVGLDGIHGATFSSETLHSKSPVSAVQIGDPITQKKLSDALVKEVRDLGLYSSITDNGAGGLSCSVAEMARESGGFEVQLDQIPVKYAGLEPWQIWVSESQERMTLAVPKKKWLAFQKVMKKHDVEVAKIGTFTKSGQCLVKYHKQVVMDMSMEFLHDGLPSRHQTSQISTTQLRAPKADAFPLKKLWLEVLAQPSVSSTAYISQQFDHEVQGTSVLKPLQGKGRVNGDASVIRPVLSSKKGVAVSQALFPSYSEIDAYQMAAATIDTAIRNLVTVGVNPQQIALLDNFCWCSSTDPVRLGQLKAAAEACYDFSVIYGAPFISGKDSMFNDFKGFDENGKPVKISIPPTLLISSLATMEDVSHVVSMDVKATGDLVYLLGETDVELGGSELYRVLAKRERSEHLGIAVPTVNGSHHLQLYQAYYQAVKQQLVSGAVGVGRGGFAAALAKACLAGQLGVTLDLTSIPGTATTLLQLLFSESTGRILVTIAPQHQTAFLKTMEKQTLTYLGKVTDTGRIELRHHKTTLQLDLAELSAAYFTSSPTTHPPKLLSTPSHTAHRHNKKPNALILTGYGINCEEETLHAFQLAGGTGNIVHINELIAKPRLLDQAEILAVPGGFSFGDDLGSGTAYAQKLMNNLWQPLQKFISQDKLVIGICNGCQVLVNLGLLPALGEKYGHRQVALIHNDSAQYTDRWVDVAMEGQTPWLRDITSLMLPIAHGEGKFYADQQTLTELELAGQVSGRYVEGEICHHFRLAANPNGSAHNIASLTDPSGRVLGIMPHPERACHFTQLPHWSWLKEHRLRNGQALPETGPGLRVFTNAVTYFTG